LSRRSAKRSSALGVSNIRTFVDPQNPSQVAVLMDVADMDVLMAAMQSEAMVEAMAYDGRARRDLGDPRRGVVLFLRSAGARRPDAVATFRSLSNSRSISP